MFARAGAIIPRMYVDDQTLNIMGKRADGSVRDELIVGVYAGAPPSSFTLYEDDGETIAYQSGEVRTTVISQRQTGAGVTVTLRSASGEYAGAPARRDNVVSLILDNPGSITSVTLNGARLRRYDTQAELDAAPSGWLNAGGNPIVAKSGELDVTRTKTFEFRVWRPSVYLPVVPKLHGRPVSW